MSEEAKDEVGNEAVTTAAIEGEAPHVTQVIADNMASPGKPVTTQMLVETLKRIESQVRKNYPDPDRVVIHGLGPNMVIHQDFRRDPGPVPSSVLNPRVALVNGKPIKVGSVTVPPVTDRDGVVVRSSYELPVYAAADSNGHPWRDSNGEYVVIDPQTGSVRQRVKNKALAVRRRSWLEVKWILLKQWFRGLRNLRFDFKIIKRV